MCPAAYLNFPRPLWTEGDGVRVFLSTADTCDPLVSVAGGVLCVAGHRRHLCSPLMTCQWHLLPQRDDQKYQERLPVSAKLAQINSQTQRASTCSMPHFTVRFICRRMGGSEHPRDFPNTTRPGSLLPLPLHPDCRVYSSSLVFISLYLPVPHPACDGGS